MVIGASAVPSHAASSVVPVHVQPRLNSNESPGTSAALLARGDRPPRRRLRRASGRVAAVGAIDVERSTIERHRRRGGHSRACREGDENERDELSEVASNAHA